MAIEFTHRLMTSVDTIAAIAMCVWSFLAFPRKHAVRRYAALSVVFLLIEALLGAGSLLLRYVAKDQSTGRAWFSHLTNTMLLLAALTVVAWLAQTNTQRIRFLDAPRGLLGALLVTVVVVDLGRHFGAGPTGWSG